MEAKIREFWDWFIIHERKFREVEDPEKVVNMLNDRVLDFGFFRWELGEGTYKPHRFIISPNGDRQRLQLSKQIMALAPIMPDWEFFPFKPPGEWDYTFSMYDAAMMLQTFNAANWRCLIETDADHRIKVILCGENLWRLDPDDLPAAANLVVTNIVGEEFRIYHIRDIELYEELDEEDAEQSFPISELRDRLMFFV